MKIRPFSPRRRTRSRTPSDRVLQEILTGPDTPHRRELEILIEDSRG